MTCLTFKYERGSREIFLRKYDRREEKVLVLDEIYILLIQKYFKLIGILFVIKFS